jgi:hypothetical protein
MAASKKSKGVAKKSQLRGMELQHMRTQELPPPPIIADDIVAELQGSTLEEIVQRAQGALQVPSAEQQCPHTQQQQIQPKRSKDKSPKPDNAYRIAKGGCKVRTLASKTLYKSSTASRSALDFLRSVESKRTRKYAQR